MKIKLTNGAKAPTKATQGSAGYDIYALEEGGVAGGCTGVFDTGVALEIPRGQFGRIITRSSLARQGMHIEGIIDSDYRGAIKLVIQNHSASWFSVKKGDRLAQIIFEPCVSHEFEEVDELVSTDRGTGGFGSTGK